MRKLGGVLHKLDAVRGSSLLRSLLSRSIGGVHETSPLSADQLALEKGDVGLIVAMEIKHSLRHNIEGNMGHGLRVDSRFKPRKESTRVDSQ